jgi:hypothetical protein
MRKSLLVLCTPLALTPLLAAATAPATTVEISDGDTDARVGLVDIALRGDVVVGTLINKSSDQIRDIRLLVDFEFLWKDELHPGEDSPGRSVVLTVPGTLEPNAKLAFELKPNPPIPARDDGRFQAKAHVMGYDFVEAKAAR